MKWEHVRTDERKSLQNISDILQLYFYNSNWHYCQWTISKLTTITSHPNQNFCFHLPATTSFGKIFSETVFYWIAINTIEKWFNPFLELMEQFNPSEGNEIKNLLSSLPFCASNTWWVVDMSSNISIWSSVTLGHTAHLMLIVTERDTPGCHKSVGLTLNIWLFNWPLNIRVFTFNTFIELN